MAAFLQYLAAERGAPPHTVRSYRADLLDCVAFLEPARTRARLPDADARVVRGYLADLHDRGARAAPRSPGASRRSGASSAS